MSKTFKLSSVFVILLFVVVVPITMAQGDQDNTVAVTLTEFNIDMSASIPAGPTVFEVTNQGTTEHNFEIEGQGVEEELAANLQPGETGMLEVDLEPGTYEVYCPVDNHEGEGMALQLTVTQAQTQTTPAATEEATEEATVEATEEVTGTTEAAATATPAAGEVVTGTQATTDTTTTGGQVTTLPQTGGEASPWPAILLLAIGALFLVGGLSLALTRRARS
jgi:hypothetical protein